MNYLVVVPHDTLNLANKGIGSRFSREQKKKKLAWSTEICLVSQSGQAC